MRIHRVLPMSVLLLAACETTPVNTAKLEEPRRRCDTVVTGSRIPQCDRTDVRVYTREQVERDPTAFEGSFVPGALKGD